MICPKCRSDSTGVYDSRSTHAGRAIRRRQCTDCSYRFTTIEEVKVPKTPKPHAGESE